LKALYQEGHDFFDMMIPFVVSSIRKNFLESVTARDLQQYLYEDHRIRISIHNAAVLVTKLVQKELCVDLYGKCMVDAQRLPTSTDLVEIQRQHDENEVIINENFAAYCKHHGYTPSDSFTNLFLRFVESYHRPLLDYFAAEEPSEIALLELTDAEDKLIAAYVNERINGHQVIRSIIVQFLQGYSLMNAFRLDRPEENTNLDLSQTEFYLDSGILLGLLGYQGPYYEAATREVVEGLKTMKARLFAYHATVSEAIRILDFYRRHIDTVEGRSRMHPTDITKHFLKKRYDSQKIRDFIEDIGGHIDDHGIKEVDYPTHKRRFTMDEKKLEGLLKKRHETRPHLIDYRVNHDVDTVAAIATLRKGKYAGSLEKVGALFVSDGYHTTQTITKWYRDEGGQGIGPIMSDVTLSNIMLLRRPDIFGDYKLNELGAVCFATLQPTPKLWTRFVENVRNLEARGFMQKEEAALMKSTDMVYDLLIERSIKGYDEATDLTEVIENARNLVNRQIEEAVAPRNQEIESLKQSLGEVTARARSTGESYDQLKGWIARMVSRTILVLVGAGFIAWSIYDFIQGMESGQPVWRSIVIAVVAVIGVLGVLNGFSFLSWTQSIEQRIKDSIGKK